MILVTIEAPAVEGLTFLGLNECLRGQQSKKASTYPNHIPAHSVEDPKIQSGEALPHTPLNTEHALRVCRTCPRRRGNNR